MSFIICFDFRTNPVIRQNYRQLKLMVCYRLTLKKRLANATDWTGVVSAGGRASGGGSNTALLDMEVGDQAAVWLVSGNLATDADRESPSTSFSGFRIIKK